MCEHRHDILTPFFAVQNKAICPGQAHTHTSRRTELWTCLEGTRLVMPNNPKMGSVGLRRAQTHREGARRKAEGS